MSGNCSANALFYKKSISVFSIGTSALTVRTVFTIFAEQLQFQNIIKFKGKVNLNNKIAKTKGMKVYFIPYEMSR